MDFLVYGLIVFFLLVVVYLFGGVGRPDLNQEYYENLTAALEKRNREKNEARKS
jgi:cbb3-type cytochrome oxidase subunit 3